MSTAHQSNDFDERKRALRRELRARLRALSAAELKSAGRAAAEALAAWLSANAPAGPVALFAARPFEIDTRPLDDALRAVGRVRLLPAIQDDRLQFRALPHDVAAHELPGDRFGIPTPPPSLPAVPLLAAAVVVVPACAVDAQGRRLGWGKGYYDRALSPRRPLGDEQGRARDTVAFVLDCQLVDEVPHDPRDVLIERLCTPGRGVFLVS
ncbi:MAG: 5-formyltetrahydrofolate cyclo-ligase [Deltaproteobacteria bacterium RBG_16_71_12]|nr:MAG: 5-formyltetrahydrofolate cyclo-ligase [Deltaproteobacteria bacterium RBG_16_71_12]